MSQVSIEADFFGDARSQLSRTLASNGIRVGDDLDAERVCIVFFNVLHRHIPRAQREVLFSDALKAGRFSENAGYGVDRIVEACVKGDDLAQHLSTRLLDASYNDMLLNHFGIHHLHLGPQRSGNFAERTDELLFAMVRPARLYLIDVADHQAFEELELLEVARRNWPDLLPVVPSLRGTGKRLSPQELRETRRAGVFSLIELRDGAVVMPTTGYATNGTSAAAVDRADRLLEFVGNVQAWCQQQSTAIAREIRNQRHVVLDRLHLQLVLEDNGARVIERQSRTFIAFPSGRRLA